MLRVLFSSHGERAFAVIPRDMQQQVVDVLNGLAEDPEWYRRAKKLGGSENRYRLRVGRWRILFTQSKNIIEIADIFMRKGSADYRRRKYLK